MRGLRLTLTLGSLLLVPTGAHAATITYTGGDSGTVVYTVSSGETLDTDVGYQGKCENVGGVWFDCVTFHGDTVTSAPSPCAPVGGVESCVLDPSHAGVHLVGGAGNDDVHVYTADIGGFPATTPYAIAIDGGGGNDTLVGGDAGESFNGGAGSDNITGLGGDDTVDGGDGNDTLGGDSSAQYNETTNGGNDVLHGGAGNDRLTGDSGAANAVVGHDVLDGGPGTDTVYNDWYRDNGDAEDPAPTVTFDGVANDGRPGENDNVVSIEKVDTGYMPNPVTPATFVGTGGAETFNLLFASGHVSAMGGNDVITGSDFADSLDGGAGDDQISGGFGNDVIVGGPGADNIGGDRTAACFYGPIYGSCTIGSGNDTIDAQDGDADAVDCGPGADVAYVDPIDHVFGCETVHVTTVKGPPCNPASCSTPPCTTNCGAPPSKSKRLPAPRPVLSVSKKLRLRTISRWRSLAVTCRMKAAGRCRVTVTITARDARKLRLKPKKHAKAFSLGTRSKTFKRAGKATLKIRLAKKVARALRHPRRLKVTIVATSTASGRSARTIRMRKTLKR